MANILLELPVDFAGLSYKGSSTGSTANVRHDVTAETDDKAENFYRGFCSERGRKSRQLLRTRHKLRGDLCFVLGGLEFCQRREQVQRRRSHSINNSRKELTEVRDQIRCTEMALMCRR